MKKSFNKRIKQAFILDEATLKKIERFFVKDGKSLTIRTECADDALREFPSMEDLQDYENPTEKRILSIGVSGTAKGSKSCKVDLDFQEDRIHINVRGGKDKEVEQYRDKIADIVSGTRPWHWWLSIEDGVWFTNIFFFILSFVTVWRVLSFIRARMISSGPSILDTDFFVGLFLLAALALSGLLTWLLNRAFSWLFPFSQFLIVQEKKAATRKNYLRGLFGSILLALLTSGLYQALFS